MTSDTQFSEEQLKNFGKMVVDVHSYNTNPTMMRSTTAHSLLDVVVLTKSYWDEVCEDLARLEDLKY